MARGFGVYLDGAGITDRATIIIDSEGIVQYAVSVGPGGQRDLSELAAECERVDRESKGEVQDFTTPAGVPAGAILYVKSSCGFSRAAQLARRNLHLESQIELRNVSEDAAAREQLTQKGGKDQAPCLVLGSEAIYESKDIIQRMVKAVAAL